MPVTLSIKAVPDEVAEALRERARQNHRSIQGELMAILEENLRVRPFKFALLERARAMGLHGLEGSVGLVREGRDER